MGEKLTGGLEWEDGRARGENQIWIRKWLSPFLVDFMHNNIFHFLFFFFCFSKKKNFLEPGRSLRG